ncbi:MAG: HEAT repeat domain-containing protein, partial [Planctomycetes bacterium]|nr:HEAT repeat domain-containing protein [Planctomycetota bacterium]
MTYYPSNGNSSLHRAFGVLGCFILVYWLVAGRAVANGDGVRDFKSWFQKYKKGEIHLYQSSSVPLAQEGDSSFKYYKKDNLQELDDLLLALANENNIKATQLLVDAASFRFTRQANREIEKFFEQQPWLLRDRAVDALKRIDDPDSVKWLQQRCLDSNSGWDSSFRKVIALALFGTDRALTDPALLLDLLEHKDPTVRIEALEGLGRVGTLTDLDWACNMVDDKDPMVRVAAIETAGLILSRADNKTTSQASGFLSLISRHLNDPQWTVQETILSMMEQFRNRESIPILLDFLEEVTSKPGEYRERILQRVTTVLRSLTGAPIDETDPEPWNEWWERNKDGFRLSDAPSPILRGFQLTGPAFFNIPVNSDCVYFILDISGSMRAPLLSQQNSEDPESKLDRARRELVKTLTALSPDAFFNIILFNETVQRFSDKPVKATEKAKRKAEQFFQEAHADEGTNIFDSLNSALQIKSMDLINRFDNDIQLD